MATKNPLAEATTLSDDWSKLIIPLAETMDMRDSTWQEAMPKKVYGAIRNLWAERQAFLGMVGVELRAMSKRKRRR